MMKCLVRIFYPNGLGNEAILIYAKKEFPDLKQTHNYVQLQKEIINQLRHLSKTDREENRLSMLVETEQLKQYDFSNFMSLRFAYYAFLLGIFTIANVQTPIHKLFHLSKPIFWNLIFVALTILLIIMSRTINIQHDRLMYLNFKMLCFEEMEKNKSQKK